jgi:small subunit ribosomal protein S1
MLRARMSKQDFASLLEASLKSGGGARRLKHGDTVEGTLIQIGDDTAFVDVGATTDARIDRAELLNSKGELTLKVGDRIRATVVDARSESPRLSLGVGRGPTDVSGLALARESGAPVTGRVLRAVKGGIEVDVGGVRAFCPASQLELGRVVDLAVYEGQSLEFRVLEVKDGGRSVVLSRRAILEQEQRERQHGLIEKLVVGADLDGVVHSLDRHGAVVDIGGIEGFVHISELSHHRIDRAEDAVTVGQPVTVRVLSVEEGPKGMRVRLSIKAREQAPHVDAPAPDEVLTGSVVRSAGSGVIVSTPKGEGLIPVRELGLAPGADHRRAFPAGQEIKVVVLSRDAQSGRMRLSKVRVADVEERRNYQDFSGGGAGAAAPSRSLGSLGDLLRSKLGMPEPAPAPTAPAPAAAPKPEPAPQKADAPSSRTAVDPPGVVRRRR